MSVKAIGWIIGGPDQVVAAILDVLGPNGTLMMYVGWESSTYHMSDWPADWQEKALREYPPFDIKTSRARRDWSILTEYLRTWPNAERSNNPGASMVAVGKNAKYLTENHPLQYGYGPGSPLEKLCKLGGKVLILGSPLSDVTLLHYAEHLARISSKKIVKYREPISEEEECIWKDIEEFDTSEGIVPWNREPFYFELIVQDFLKSRHVPGGKVGQGTVTC